MQIVLEGAALDWPKMRHILRRVGALIRPIEGGVKQYKMTAPNYSMVSLPMDRLARMDHPKVAVADPLCLHCLVKVIWGLPSALT